MDILSQIFRKKNFVIISIIFCTIKSLASFSFVGNKIYILLYYMIAAIFLFYYFIFKRNYILNKKMLPSLALVIMLIFSIFINFDFTNIDRIIIDVGAFAINFILLLLPDNDDFSSSYESFSYYSNIIQKIIFILLIFGYIIYILYLLKMPIPVRLIFWHDDAMYFQGVVGTPFHLGQMCNVLIGISIYNLLNNKNKFFNIVSIILALISSIISNERASLLFLIICSILFFIMYIVRMKQRNIGNIIKFLVVFLIIFVVLYVILINFGLITFRNFIKINGKNMLDASSNIRIILYITALSVLFKHNPILGLGSSKFYTLYTNEALNPSSIAFGETLVQEFSMHNDVLYIMCLTGIIGFIIFINFLRIIFVKLVKLWGLNDDSLNTIVYASIFLILCPLMESCVNEFMLHLSYTFSNLMFFLLCSTLLNYETKIKK